MTKVLGLAACWPSVIDWACATPRMVTTPHMLWLIGLAVWLASPARWWLGRAGCECRGHGARYVSFFVLFSWLVQVASRGEWLTEVLVTVAVAAAAVAATARLFELRGRASRPEPPGRWPAPTTSRPAREHAAARHIAIPLGTGWQMVSAGSVLAALMIAATTATTLSRGAAVGLRGGLLWLVLDGRCGPRSAAGRRLAGGVAWGSRCTDAASSPGSRARRPARSGWPGSECAVEHGSSLADARTTSSSRRPITGVGAGNYQARVREFGLPFRVRHRGAGTAPTRTSTSSPSSGWTGRCCSSDLSPAHATCGCGPRRSPCGRVPVSAGGVVRHRLCRGRFLVRRLLRPAEYCRAMRHGRQCFRCAAAARL